MQELRPTDPVSRLDVASQMNISSLKNHFVFSSTTMDMNTSKTADIGTSNNRPNFFEFEKDRTVTVDSQRYIVMINDHFHSSIAKYCSFQ